MRSKIAQGFTGNNITVNLIEGISVKTLCAAIADRKACLRRVYRFREDNFECNIVNIGFPLGSDNVMIKLGCVVIVVVPISNYIPMRATD